LTYAKGQPRFRIYGDRFLTVDFKHDIERGCSRRSDDKIFVSEALETHEINRDIV
jgi:hypothetical protein